jgi:DNA-directed RNA polymerase alpha subunit
MHEHPLITEDCPIECLELSARTYNAVRKGCGMEPDPETVGDLIRLWRRGLLPDVRNVGPRAISEVEVRLVFAGLDLGQHHH